MIKAEHYDTVRSGFSGGTFASVKFIINNPPKKSNLGYDPLLKKIGVNEAYTHKFKKIITRFLSYDSSIKKFIGLQALADGNADVVKRSNALNSYSESFTYKESFVYPNFFFGFIS